MWIIKIWWIIEERSRPEAIIVVVEISRAEAVISVVEISRAEAIIVVVESRLLLIIINARFDVINGILWYFKLVRGIKEKSF